jgi:NADH-quinone oxidoreductase subunit J
VTQLFFATSAVAVISTILAITNTNAVHALLYFVVSLFSAAFLFLLLGAPFVAALEVVIYAGAIIVLFLFAVMLLNLGQQGVEQERRMLKPGTWVGPTILSAVLALELMWVFRDGTEAMTGATHVGAKEVGKLLFGPYLLGVEIASMLLLAGLVGAYHLGRKDSPGREDRR